MSSKVLLGIAAVVILIGGFFYLNANKAPASTANAPVVIKGSDTEVQLVSNLAEAFHATAPDANISVTGGGSGAGIASLLNGEIDIANSSRTMKDEEKTTASSKGMDVREFVLARDGLSVIVHPSNTVKQLTVEQIGKIYRGEITNWKDVGGTPGTIVLYGRQSTSGTFTFFRDTVLKADYAESMRQMEGSQAIVDGVKADAMGIGYVGVGYAKDESGAARSDILIVPVAADAKTAPVSPLDREAVLSGKYPIFRAIYQYIKETPAKDSTLAKFLQFEASAEGQALIEKAGFYSLTAADIQANNAFFDSLK